MRFLKLKEWNGADTALVKNDKITDHGLYMYWNAIDAAFQFNKIPSRTDMTVFLHSFVTTGVMTLTIGKSGGLNEENELRVRVRAELNL